MLKKKYLNSTSDSLLSYRLIMPAIHHKDTYLNVYCLIAKKKKIITVIELRLIKHIITSIVIP